MPDITMCQSTECPLRKTCKRSQESGTVPNPLRQSWFAVPPDEMGVECDLYIPKEPVDA